MKNITNAYTFGNLYPFNDPFTIVIDTRNTKTGGSSSNEFLFPQNPDSFDANINFLVDWGDGQFSRIQSKAEALVPHVYSVPGIYTINFYKPKGAMGLRLGMRYETYQNEVNKLLKILRWGQFNNSRACFSGCINLDMSEVEGSPMFDGNSSNNFRFCSNITTFKSLSSIIFSGEIGGLFDQCSNFNQTATINAPGAVTLGFVCRLCSKLNSQIILNAPLATSFSGFFQSCILLNTLPIFNTPLAANLLNMFNGCIAFNKDVSTLFDWTKVTNMTGFMTGKSSANYNATYYDNLLIALDAGGQSNVTLGMGSIKYTAAGVTARNNLIVKNWTITDGGI